MDTPIMDLPEVAAYLKVHPSTIYRLLKKHRIPAFRVGRDWKFEIHIIDEWLRQGGSNGNGSPYTIRGS